MSAAEIAPTSEPPAEVAAALARLGVLGDPAEARFTALAGGVSSDIWRVEAGGREVCVKRARPRLAVEAVWEVPVERNHSEAEFLRVAEAEAPGLAPRLLAEDAASSLIVLPYFEPSRWTPWKTELLAGRVDTGVPERLGAALGGLVGRTIDRDDLARRFATDALFRALRLDPYLGEAARRHPDLAGPLGALIETTAETRIALVHGDVSPKNILVTATGEFRLLDAECAWYGDPAFDPAFLLNHLLLKTIHRPESAAGYRAAFAAFLRSYAAALPAACEAILVRVARLLPGLLLARIDGKSPVEYLTDPRRRDAVRRVGRQFLLQPPGSAELLADAIAEEAEG